MCDGGLLLYCRKYAYIMKGMKYMAIIRSFSTFANAQINAYRGLAKKATETGGAGVDSQDSGVVAALKRFFYKLDFLLKYGQFPSVGDTAPDALPPELQELKTFLETPQDAGKSYILQKDINTRYRFTRSDTDTSQITVTEERRYVSPAGARTGYACNDKWRENDSQPCEKNELLSSLNGVNQTSAKKTAEDQTSTEKPAEGQAPGEVNSSEDAPYPKRHVAIFNAKTRMIIWDDGSQSVLPPGWDMRFALDQVTKQQIDSFVKQQDT